MIAAGKADLAFGRLVEGHVNAVQLVTRYGSADQKATLEKLISNGARLGVWNSDLPNHALHIQDGQLIGGKNYASGLGLLTHAIVTTEANDPAFCQMFLISLDQGSFEADKTGWQPFGMKRTNSYSVSWSGTSPAFIEEIGEPGDYQRQPFFSAGALRFTAAHVGGIVKLYEQFRAELITKNRLAHPQQERRLSEAYIAAQSAVDVVLATASRYDEENTALTDQVGYARLAIMDLAEAQVMRVQRGAGMASVQASHPLSETLTDLMTYLRQPNPDGASSALGAAALRIRI